MTDDDDDNDDDNDDRAFISGSIAVATVAMPVVVLFIVLSDGFCRIAVTLRMKREPCVCPMQRAGHNCCVPAVDPFQTGFNMSLSAFFWAFCVILNTQCSNKVFFYYYFYSSNRIF